MSVAVETKVQCDECAQGADRALCNGCYDEQIDKATESALVGYMPDDEIPEVNADAVREWLDRERLKPAVTMSAETIAAFERCIDDLR